MFTKKIAIFLILLAAAFCGGLVTADAADVLAPKTAAQEEFLSADPDLNELLDEAPPVAAPRREPTTIEDFANRYYSNCVAQDHPFLRGEDVKLLCGCTSAKIPENMTVQQMRDMQDNTQEGQTQRARMLMFVYTPCISYPTRALVNDQCINNPEIKSTLKHYQDVCRCLGDSMADYMDERAPDAMEAALTRNMTDVDPLRTLMESKGFEKYSSFYMKKCVEKHEFGLGK